MSAVGWPTWAIPEFSEMKMVPASGADHPYDGPALPDQDLTFTANAESCEQVRTYLLEQVPMDVVRPTQPPVEPIENALPAADPLLLTFEMTTTEVKMARYHARIKANWSCTLDTLVYTQGRLNDVLCALYVSLKYGDPERPMKFEPQKATVSFVPASVDVEAHVVLDFWALWRSA